MTLPLQRIGLIEDQRLVLGLLRSLIENTGRYAVVFAVASQSEARQALNSEVADVVVLDIGLPDADGILLGGELKQFNPKLKIILISAESTDATLLRVMESGMDGFVDKNSAPEQLITALDTVSSGCPWYAPSLLSTRRRINSDPQAFSKIIGEQEMMLMSLFGLGLPDDEIAERVHLAANTVKWHRGRVTRKLGLKSPRDLMRYCLEKGFVRVGPDGRIHRMTMPSPEASLM